MTEPNWISLKTGHKVSAARNKDGNVWQVALPFLQNPGFFKIVASGEWSYSSKFGLKCSANGDLLAPFDPKRCVHENSPIGCLIGRIGGSVAARTSEGIFTVGSYCVRKLEVETQGPLFLAINDLWTGFDDNSDELTVNIFFGSLPSPAP
jgi:hypothetical protein